MPIYKILLNSTGRILFVTFLIFFSTLEAKNLDKYNKADKIADYFTGILLLNQSKYEDSLKHLSKLDGLEETHAAFAKKYLYSLVNSGNLKKGFSFSKKLEREKQDSFESNLISGLFFLKNSKFNTSKAYFSKAKERNSGSILDIYIANTLYIWSNLKNSDLDEAKKALDNLDNRFENLKKIQTAFLNCYFGTDETDILFNELVKNQNTDFSRYNYFYAKFLEKSGKKDKAKKIVETSLERFPRNILLNQYKIDLNKPTTNIDFDCKNEKDVIAELLYIAANALSSQSIYSLSNFYLNLSKYLNEDFHAFDTLMAENFYNIDDYFSAKKVYKRLRNQGSAFKWYADKQISRILILEEKKEKALKLLNASYNEFKGKGVYEIYDYAEFLKNNEKFEQSIAYYSEILKRIDKKHPLFPEVSDSRGVAYERIGKWDNAEKDLLASLEVSPDQAYVINYLAYSWIEQGVKIEKSLSMLEKANRLKSNDPYIIDSLGWALFKLKRYTESKDYLQLAVKLMPSDPIVNDHYGDVLWKNGDEIQARYYWSYVLNLEKAEKNLKEKIKKKLIKGL